MLALPPTCFSVWPRTLPFVLHPAAPAGAPCGCAGSNFDIIISWTYSLRWTFLNTVFCTWVIGAHDTMPRQEASLLRQEAFKLSAVGRPPLSRQRTRLVQDAPWWWHAPEAAVWVAMTVCSWAAGGLGPWLR